MKDSLNNFICNVGDSGLFVAELPTGFGKTTFVKEYIYEYLTGSIENAPSRVFYLTPLIKNIDDLYQGVRHIFEEKNDLKTFDDNVLLLRANYESVLKTFENFEIQDEFTKLESFKKLKRKVDSYYRILGQTNDENNEDVKDLENQIREEFEPAFRKDLEFKISKWTNEKGYSAKLKRIQNEFKWILSAYPAILSKKRRVIITTVDKFYYGNNTILDKHYRFIVNSITNKSLVFIDESDSAKQRLLSDMIQECSDDKLDTLRIIRCIHHAINNDKISKDLLKQLPTNDKNKTTEESLKKLKKVFANLYEKNNLDYQFKLEVEDTDNFFLFHDFITTTLINGQNLNSISVVCDTKRDLNVISISKDNNDNSFNNLIRSIQGALNFFINFCNTTAKNVMAYKNNQDSIKQMEIEDAVTSVLHCFNLSDQDIKSLTRVVINNYKTPRLEIKKSFLTYDLYDDGFQYFDFENDESHDFNTTIRLSFLNDTPEKFLLTLARRAYVVCMSATANSNSATGNFNIQYLEDNLGDKYFKLSEPKLDELSNYYKNNRLKEHKIDFVECFLKDKTKPEESVFEAPYLEQFELVIAPYKSEPINQDGERFFLNRFCRFAIALKKFVQNEKSVVFLSLNNQNLKTSSNEIFNISNVNEIIKIACEETNVTKIPTVISLTSTRFDAQKKEYLNRAKNGERVVLITSYPTASTGQNLQYELEELGNIKEVDIDSIYIENPTNLLTRLDTNSDKSDLIKYVYQTLSLRSHGELNLNESSFILKTGFKNIINSNIDKKDDPAFDKRFKTNSVNNHAVATIKQGIGRINRTGNKNDTIIYVDNEIIAKRWFDEEIGKMQTPEFDLLMKNSNDSLKPTAEDKLNLNRAVINCRSSQRSIDNMRRIENDSWSFSNSEEWKKLRLFVVKYPTINLSELNENTEFKQLYLKAKSSYKISYYYVKLSENSFDKIDDISYIETPHCNLKVNKVMCRLPHLMSIKVLKDHFIENGYATDFEPKDYILIPNIIRNIYMGALGEISGKFVFDNYIKEPLIEITDLSKFEMFDYQLSINKDVYIDFKNWSFSSQKEEDEFNSLCSKKLDKVGGKCLFVINMFADDKFKCYRVDKDKRIIVIPYLFKKISEGKYIIDEDICSKIRKFLEGFNCENKN